MNRIDVLEQAVYECYKEMYRKAQPSIDFDEILQAAKEGKEDKKFPFYRQHYLSSEEYTDIVESYIYAYHIRRNTKDHMELVRDYFVNGGTKDKYIDAHTDEYGYHPGYRGYEKTPKLIDLIGEEATNKVLELLDDCINFYGTEHEECRFRFSVMDCSPTSNKQEVIDYWKSKGVDLEIKEYNSYEDE